MRYIFTVKNWDIKQQCLFLKLNGCLFSWGANKLMSFSGSVQLCGNRSAVMYFRPRGSFSANFCPVFLKPETQSAIDQSLPTPAHQRKAPGTNKLMRGFANSLICFVKKLHNIWVVSWVDCLLTIGDRYWRKLYTTEFNFGLSHHDFNYHVILLVSKPHVDRENSCQIVQIIDA